MFEKIKTVIDFLNGIFYGDHWYIAWGVILIIIALGVVKDIPKLVKSIKNMKNKGR